MKYTSISLAVSLALLPSLAAAQLEEVIVTAQKKDETLTSAPVAVSVVSGQEINDLSIFQADELSKLVTGMEIRYEGNSNVGVGLRGVGTFKTQAAPARVGTYLDNFYMASQASFALGSMFDLASVQVLKGPQGTLYGQPSPTGALILTSEDPNFDGVSGYVRGSVVDPKGYNLQGAVNIPIVEDKLALRFAALTDQRETGVENIVRGLDEERNRDGYRVKLLWEPSDTFSAKLGYTAMATEKSDTYRVLETVAPELANFDNLKAGDRIAIADAPTEVRKLEESFLTLDLAWQIGDIDMSWFSGMLDSDMDRISDEDKTDEPIRTLGLQTAYGDGGDSNQHELRISGTAFDFWDWTVGGYYGEAFAQSDVQTSVNPPGGVFSLVLDIPVDSKTTAIFTHNTIALTQDTELTIGVRYNEFEQETNTSIGGDFLVGSALLPGGGISEPIFVAEDVFPCIDGSQSPCFSPSDNKEEEWTGTIKLSHFFSDALNLYGTIDRGYRPGAPNFDTTGAFRPEFNTYAGEKVNSFEIGAKGDILEGRARYTTAFFYSVYEDYQAPVNFEVYNTVTEEVTQVSSAPFINVDEAVQMGIEADFRMMVTDNWSVYAGFTYTNVELTDGVVPCTDPSQPPVGPDNRFNTCDADGEAASSQPDWTGVLQSEYTWPQLIAGSDVYVNALWSYKGETEAPGDTVGRFDTESFSTLDLYTGLRNESWTAQLFVKNALDDDGVLGKRPAGDAYNDLTVSPPRTVGLTASYHF